MDLGTDKLSVKNLPSLVHPLPYALPCVADARLSLTQYADDTAWVAHFGTADTPAVAMQTRYGGRANLVSLVPMWTHNGQVRYEASVYHDLPRLVAVTTNYQAIEARPFPNVLWVGEHVALDSYTMGGIYHIMNEGEQPITLTIELYGHVIVGGNEQRVRTDAKSGVLSLAQVGDLQPAVLMEKGEANPDSNARIGVTLQLPAGKAQTVRWVAVAQTSLTASVAYGGAWLKQNWKPFFQEIDKASQAIAYFETGDSVVDALLLASSVRTLQAFVTASGRLPAPVLVQTRHIHTGYSANGDGSDYLRAWKGIDIFTAASIASPLATMSVELSQGLVFNFLATQLESGFVDLRPAPSGQMSGVLCTPLLCEMAWRVYDITQDKEFLTRIFSKLQAFITYWLQPLAGKKPLTWHDERQMGYPYFPTFSTQAWGQGVSTRTVSSPDLLAYLIGECEALAKMAHASSDKKGATAWGKQASVLRQMLAKHWAGNRYAYQDIALGTVALAHTLLKDGAGDEEHFIQAGLASRSRLQVRVVGGVSHVPTFSMTLSGVGHDGQPLEETFTQKDFVWHNRHGFLTTTSIYQQLDRVTCKGLSRVYRVTVTTPDLTGQDINGIVPLGILGEHTETLLKTLTDEKSFWGVHGVTMLPSEPVDIELSEAWGAGGVWLYWQSRLAPFLPARQQLALLERILGVQADVLKQTGKFAQAYHGKRSVGIGEADYLSGVAPLAMLTQAVGVQIVSQREVRISPDFAWGKSITVTQHGVVVRRTRNQVTIKFPTGQRVKWVASDGAQVITDPKAKAQTLLKRFESPSRSLPSSRTTGTANRVMIPIERED